MIIGRVVGETVATQKHPSHEGLKLLLVAPADLDGNPLEDTAPFVAVDSADAGVGVVERDAHGPEHQEQAQDHQGQSKPAVVLGITCVSACGCRVVGWLVAGCRVASFVAVLFSFP